MVKKYNERSSEDGKKKKYFFVFRKKIPSENKIVFASREEKKKYYREKRKRMNVLRMKKKDMEEKWGCPICNYTTGRKSNVKRHMIRVHKSKPEEATPVLLEKKKIGIDIVKYGMYIRPDLRSCIDSILSDVKLWNDPKTNPDRRIYKMMGMEIPKINPSIHIETILLNKMMFLNDKHINPYRLINEKMTEETIQKIRTKEIDMDEMLRERKNKIDVYQGVICYTVINYVKACINEDVKYEEKVMSDPYFLRAVERIFDKLIIVLQSGYECKNICFYCKRYVKKPLHHFYICDKFIEKLMNSKNIFADINFGLTRLRIKNKKRTSIENIKYVLYNRGIGSSEDLKYVLKKNISDALKGIFRDKAPVYNEKGLIEGTEMLGDKSLSNISYNFIRRNSKSLIRKMVKEINKMKKDKRRQYAMKFYNPFDELEKMKKDEETPMVVEESKKKKKIREINIKYEQKIKNIGKADSEVLEVNTQYRVHEEENLIQKKNEEIRNILEYREINARRGFQYTFQSKNGDVNYDVYVNTEKKYEDWYTREQERLNKEIKKYNEEKYKYMSENIVFYDLISSDPRLMKCLESVLFYLNTKVPKNGKGAINFYISRIELIMGIRSALQNVGKEYIFQHKDKNCSLYGKEKELKIAQRNLKTILIFEKLNTKDKLDDLFDNEDSDTENDDTEREKNDLIKTLGIDKNTKDFEKKMEIAKEELMSEKELRRKNYILQKMAEKEKEKKTVVCGINSITFEKPAEQAEKSKNDEVVGNIYTKIFEYVPEKKFEKKNSFSSIFEARESTKMMMSDPLCMWLFTARGKLAVFNNDFIHDNEKFEDSESVMRYLFYLSMSDIENEKMLNFFFLSTEETEKEMLDEIEKIKMKKVNYLNDFSLKGTAKIKELNRKMIAMNIPNNKIKIINAIFETKRILGGWLSKARKEEEKEKKEKFQIPDFDGNTIKKNKNSKFYTVITREQIEKLQRSLNVYSLSPEEWNVLYEEEENQREKAKLKRQITGLFGDMSFGEVLKRRIRDINNLKKGLEENPETIDKIRVKKKEIREKMKELEEMGKEMRLEKEFDILEKIEKNPNK